MQGAWVYRNWNQKNRSSAGALFKPLPIYSPTCIFDDPSRIHIVRMSVTTLYLTLQSTSGNVCQSDDKI